MDPDAEIAVQAVIAEGILTPDEARAARDAALRAGRDLLEHLAAQGQISPSTFASLQARVRAPDVEASTDQPTPLALPGPRRQRADSAEPADPADLDAFPVPGWDRYEPIRLLGQGGMGRVYLARDLRLGREVALKFVRDEDPELGQRIVAEARAQARVDDERVCKVYEVGEVRGRVYIAMQHIAGRSLSELGKELSYEEKAIVLRGAALGVAEAHRVGLIHRDLKPSNIMVERGPDGVLKPYVMDFGVARDWTSGATLTGTVLGTPHYMAPEQARGEVTRLDRRADVYSLGATLYALLARRPPVEGDSPIVVLMRVCTDEPPRPRVIDPDVPADLEAIAMKCLEKDRGARYESARALADDLGRFLAGEPVEARASAGAGYRLRKWVRRRARLVAGVAAAVVLVAVMAGLAWRERAQAARRAELARAFTERVERIESMARYAALAPAHDLRPDRARLGAAMRELTAEVHEGGALAEGPGRYALGRGHLALGDDAAAAVELAAAWDGGYREPRVAYALALVEGRLYQQALREIERVPRELREERSRDIARRYREPALAHLRESAGADVPSLDYVAALIAYYEERWDDALRRLDAIGDGAPGLAWFYEAPLLRGEILRARAMARLATASPAQTAADLEAGRQALAAAAAIGRSEPAIYVAQGELEASALARQQYGGGAVDAPFERGVEAAGRALAVSPDDLAALALRVSLLRQLAEHRSNRGEPAEPLLARALADAERAVTLAPRRRESVLALARVHHQWGNERQNRGQDPTPQLARARGVTEAIAPAERDYEVHVLIGLIHKTWADYLGGTGQDAALHRSLAIDAYRSAIRLDDRRSQAWLNLAINYYERAAQPRGQDPEVDLGRALEALARGKTLDPASFVPRFYEGEAYARLAERKQARGADPEPDRARALERYREGLAINPKLPHFHNGISIVQLLQARDAAARGADPVPLFDAAQAAAAQAIAVAPDQGYGYSNLGDVLTQRAAYDRAQGRDPRPRAREAIAALDQALARIPTNPTFLCNLAAVHALVAAYEIDRGIDPRDSLARARQRVEQALEKDPTSAEGKRLTALVAELEARWRRGTAAAAAPRP